MVISKGYIVVIQVEESKLTEYVYTSSDKGEVCHTSVWILVAKYSREMRDLK